MEVGASGLIPLRALLLVDQAPMNRQGSVTPQNPNMAVSIASELTKEQALHILLSQIF